MKDPRSVLTEKLQIARTEAQLAGRLFLLAFVLTLPALMINLPGTGFSSYPMPWWAETMRILGLISFFCALLAYRQGAGTRQRYRHLAKGRCHTTYLEVQDRFTYIKMLPGEEGLLEFQYFVVTAAGTWRLAEDKLDLFNQLKPGTRITAAVIEGSRSREMVDLEIKTPGMVTQALNFNTITDKAVSEVKIIGYQEGSFEVGKLQICKEVRHYFIVNNRPVQVQENEFTQATINQKYYLPEEAHSEYNSQTLEAYSYLEIPA